MAALSLYLFGIKEGPRVRPLTDVTFGTLHWVLASRAFLGMIFAFWSLLGLTLTS